MKLLALLTTGLCAAALPAQAQDQPFPPIGGDVPIDPNPCPGCLQGGVTLTYSWTCTSTSFQASGGVPANARVRVVYMPTLPTGSGILIDQITLTQCSQPGCGWPSVLFQTYTDGSYLWHNASWPDLSFAGFSVNPVDGSHWFVAPRIRAYSCPATLQVIVVIEYSFDPPPPPPPRVIAVTPNTGPTTGQTSITITGTNFNSGAVVLFGNTPATAVIVVNSTTITAFAPPHVVGFVPVTVNIGSVGGTLPNAFMYYSSDIIMNVVDTILN